MFYEQRFQLVNIFPYSGTNYNSVVFIYHLKLISIHLQKQRNKKNVFLKLLLNVVVACMNLSLFLMKYRSVFRYEKALEDCFNMISFLLFRPFPDSIPVFISLPYNSFYRLNMMMMILYPSLILSSYILIKSILSYKLLLQINT